jgi:hypothetical protein
MYNYSSWETQLIKELHSNLFKARMPILKPISHKLELLIKKMAHFYNQYQATHLGIQNINLRFIAQGRNNLNCLTATIELKKR